MHADQRPLVSVVMPVRDGEASLDAAIASITDQSLKDLELIIVDDGSTDGTSKLVQSWVAKDPRIHAHTTTKRGIVHALNHGLDQARGQYIARMDADDVSHPDRLSRQCAFLDEHADVGLVSCLVEYAGCEESQLGYARYVEWVNTVQSVEDISLHRFVESPLPHPSVMFRREVWEKHGGYKPGGFPEDYELWLRWLEAGINMAKVPEPLLTWNDEPTRLSRQDSRYSVDAFYACKTEYVARWLKAHNPHHPHVSIWGAGRTSRLRAELLCRHGIVIDAYVDVDPGKIGQQIGGRPIIEANALPSPDTCMVLSYVGSRGARALICKELDRYGFEAGLNYICAA